MKGTALVISVLTLAGLPATNAQPGRTILGITNGQFAVNGRPTFLLGFSYFAALGAPEAFARRDLKDFQSRGFNWLRVWATWAAFDNDVSAVDVAGNPREPFLSRLKWLVDECARREPGMTVDSEAIFAVAAHSEGTAEALEALRGSMATAWIDERREESVSVARGVGRPVWLGAGDNGVFFASTKLALEVVERFLGLKLEMAELQEGTLVQLEQGRETSRTRFNPDRRFEDAPLPPVRAPKEAALCLKRLAILAAAAH